MPKSIFTALLIFFSLSATISYAQVPTIENIQSRKIQSLNGKWNYIVDPYENGYYDANHEPYDKSKTGSGGYFDDKQVKDKSDLVEYDFDRSPLMNVPGDWNSQSDQLSLYEGTVWLRRKFDAKPEKGKKYFIYFGAVNYEAHVYLNGKKLGVHKGGFTPFQFDVTNKLKEGQNSIVLKIDNNRKADEIPSGIADWWNYGGITRDVFLAEFPEHFIADYKLQLQKGNSNLLSFSVKLADASANQEVTLSIPELKLEKKYKTDVDGKIHDDFTWNNLDFWSPENPKLYAVNIKSDKEDINDLIGFRTISVDGDSILLNGKSVFLRGISLQDENPLLAGRLRSDADMRMMLKWAKDLNCNYVRLANFPHHEEMIRLADEMGLLVWTEIPVNRSTNFSSPATYANAKAQLSDLIQRDKNRASVIVWSVGNETPPTDSRLSFMSNLVETARTLDDTRLVAAALSIRREGSNVVVNDPLGDKIDILSFSEYAGWNAGESATDMAKYTFDVKQKKPVVVMAFGGEALGGFYGDENTRWTEEFQESLYKNQFSMLSKISGLRGMSPSALTDFRSPIKQHPVYQNFWSRKGLISETGQEKKAFYVLKSFYAELKEKYK